MRIEIFDSAKQDLSDGAVFYENSSSAKYISIEELKVSYENRVTSHK